MYPRPGPYTVDKEGRMNGEQERVLDQERADARERVRAAQEREERVRVNRHRVAVERARERAHAAGTQGNARTDAAGDDVEDDEAPDV